MESISAVKAIVEKYTRDPAEDKKILVSNDAFMQAELIEELINSIKAVRLRING